MSLVVHLPLLGNLDNTGIGNSTITNINSTIKDIGKFGKCYTTNGSNAYITGTYTATANMSFCIWAKFNASFTGHLVDGRVTESGYQPMYVTPNSLQSGGNETGFPTFVYSFSTGVWYHICIVYTADDVSFYANGSIVATSTIGKGYAYGEREFTLCCRHSHNNYFLPADIQDFRIYDHSLSALEVKEISKALLLHYPMNGGGRGQKNEIRNGSFSEGSGNLVGWNNWGSCTIRQVDNIDSVNYAHIETTGTKWQGLSQNLGTPLDVSSHYTLSFKAFSPTSHSMCMGFHWNDSSGNIKSQSWYTQELTTEPKEYHVVITTGAIVDRFNMMLGWNTDEIAEIYFTDVKLEKGDYATPFIPHMQDASYSELGYNFGIEYDTSGYNKNGNISGTINYVSDTPRYSVCSSFTDSSYITYKLPENMYYATYSFWVKSSTWSTYGAIHMQSGNPSGGDSPWFSANTEGCALWMYFGGNSPNYCKVSGALSDDTWYHCAMVWNNGVAQWYLNGEKFGNAVTFTGKTYITNSTTSTIGDSYTGSSWGGTKFSGQISDWRVYATALSADDIKQLYNTSASIANNGTLFGYEFAET